MTAEAILSRLDRVRRTGDRRWIARCPAHDDDGPSLSIREADDGRALVHCFAGCTTAAVLDALGCAWTDLFPPRARGDAPSRRRREPVADCATALRALAHEVRIVVLLAGDLARGEAISEPDRQRLIVAAGRLAAAESAVLP